MYQDDKQPADPPDSTTASPTWTVKDLLLWTTSYLEKNLSESARLDAEILLAHCLDCPRIMLYTRYDEVVGEQGRQSFRELVRQRATGTPVAYLVGHREFYSLRFDVSNQVLIPRPATEFAVIAVLDIIKKHFPNQPRSIADVGTGSGVIAVTLARELPGVRFTAIDISPSALDVAATNATRHHVSDQIQFLQQDLLSDPSPDLFDIIVSNPPYVRSDEYAQLSRDIRDYEPQIALEAGPTGMEVYDRLIPQAASRLQNQGWLVLETSPMLIDTLQQTVVRAGFDSVEAVSDLEGHGRIVVARRQHD